MTRILAIPLSYILNGLYNIFDNYGLTIIVFTVIIRLIILPLYNMQMKSTEQMQLIQPQLKELQTKYADDREKMNEKMQELYADHKINPAMGCLPLLIQLPIIWALFAVLRDPMEYITNTDMVLAVHESFLWIKDLSQPDLWALPIIAGVATFVSMKISTSMTSTTGANSSANTSMKAMQYFMPVMIVWMGRSLPAGLCIYWIMSYIFQIIQTKVRMMSRARKAKAAEKETKEKKKAK